MQDLTQVRLKDFSGLQRMVQENELLFFRILYESIENYINKFAKVFVLYERGMPLPLIRRVTGRSIRCHLN